MSTLQEMPGGAVLPMAQPVRTSVQSMLESAARTEIPPGDLCLKIARDYHRAGDDASACRWLCRVVDAEEKFTPWHAAAMLLNTIARRHAPAASRVVKLAILGSYTTAQYALMCRLAALRRNVLLNVYECDYGQFQQDILDPDSGLYKFQPELIILAVHDAEVDLPMFSDDPATAVERELERWTSLWSRVRKQSAAQLIMHNFVLPAENPFGHLSTRLAGSRQSMLQQLNRRLGETAGNDVNIMDCDRIASIFGKRRWFDDKYWHISKHAVALDALPLLAKHTAAFVAAMLGLSKKCIVLDLDNTLWGGVVGEDGVAGIRLGAGTPQGEAFAHFQESILALKQRGVMLAACSKNNERDAKEVFQSHPDMRLRLDDFAAFMANWEGKPENLRRIASLLNIGLDSMVFVDDNPAERALVRQCLPEVEVLPMPADPVHYARTLSECLHFETAAFTAEDRDRNEQYRARAQTAAMQSTAGSLEEFLCSLKMQAAIAPFDELHLPRIVQLIGKTNQFNLTTRRHGMETVRQFMRDPNCVHFSLKLRDRFTDHGLVAVLIAFKRGVTMEIDTWLMSCRVIGRTVEAQMLAHLCNAAAHHACTQIRGVHIPTPKNQPVADVFARFGFVREPASSDSHACWIYALKQNGPIQPGPIEVVAAENWSQTHADNS